MSKKVIALDPGNVRSAFIIWDGDTVTEKGLVENEELRNLLPSLRAHSDHLLVEMISSYGLPVGKTVFDTCVWIGRFIECWSELEQTTFNLVYRRDVKLHLTGKTSTKDTNIIKVLKKRFGEPGTKKQPNSVTYGIVKDIWQAFALAVYWKDIEGQVLPK